MIKLIMVLTGLTKAVFRRIKSYANDGFPYGRTQLLEKLIREHKYKKVVELGVYDGKNLFYLAEKFPETDFIGIDLWKYFPTDRINRLPLQSQTQWDDLFNFLEQRSQNFKNLRLIRDYSDKAAKNIEDNSVDLVFIDANHDYEFVKKDILAWLPKIKSNGLISGHDFSLAWLGVVKAVTEIFGTDSIDELEDAVWVTKPSNKIE
jgi:hypothetical protein